MKWHWDEENREVEILEGDGWYFQKDNELPFELKVGDIIKIKKGEYHRVIKDENVKDNLKVMITKELN